MALYTQAQDPSRNDIVAVGVTSTIVSEARNEINPRKVFIIRNNSAADADIVTLTLGFKTAVADAGIIIKKGESYGENSQAGFEAWNGTITAICATANGSLSVFER
jgi:hypothetical protein